MRNGVFLLGLCLAIGMIVSSWIGARTVERIKVRDQTIEVKGYAEKLITSDLALWSATITTRSTNLVDAYAAIERDAAKVMAFLAEKGFPEDHVAVSPVAVGQQYRLTEKGQETNEIERYVLRQTFSLQSNDVNLIAATARDASTLLREGVEIDSHAPQYLFTRLEDMKLEMIGAATANARERIKRLLEGSGVGVGRLRSASQGVFQITPAHSTEVSNYGRNDTTTIEKSIKAVVTIEYEIE